MSGAGFKSGQSDCNVQGLKGHISWGETENLHFFFFFFKGCAHHIWRFPG